MNAHCFRFCVVLKLHWNAFNCPEPPRNEQWKLWGKSQPPPLQSTAVGGVTEVMFNHIHNFTKRPSRTQCSFDEGRLCFHAPSRIWRPACGWRQDQSNRLWTNNWGRGAGWDDTAALRSDQSQQLYSIPTTQSRVAWRGKAFIRLPVWWAPSCGSSF